jgi:hypothetical protein
LDSLDLLLFTEQAFTLSEETPELSGSKMAGKNSASAANQGSGGLIGLPGQLWESRRHRESATSKPATCGESGIP